MLHRSMMRRFFFWLFAFAILSSQFRAQAQGTPDPVADLRQSFENPPDECRILLRWWWFGPSVTKDELERELRFMKTGGIGGVEVQTTYPLALDNPAIGFRNYSFLSNEYLETLRFASERARELGLRFDLTLGSGWPYGGLSVPGAQAAGVLRGLAGSPPAGAGSIALPPMGGGGEIFAAFFARAGGGKT